MSWSDTTPAPNLGTESSSDAHLSRPGDSAVTRGAETDGREAERDRHRASEDDVAGRKHRRVVRSPGPSIAGCKARTGLRKTKMTKTLLTAAALVVAITTSAVAKTYTYACQVKDERDNVHLYAAKIDTKAGTLTWRGSVYRLGPVTVDCAKYCFQATRRDGATAILSTATQGVASLQVSGRDDEFDCDLLRK